MKKGIQIVIFFITLMIFPVTAFSSASSPDSPGSEELKRVHAIVRGARIESQTANQINRAEGVPLEFKIKQQNKAIETNTQAAQATRARAGSLISAGNRPDEVEHWNQLANQFDEQTRNHKISAAENKATLETRTAHQIQNTEGASLRRKIQKHKEAAIANAHAGQLNREQAEHLRNTGADLSEIENRNQSATDFEEQAQKHRVSAFDLQTRLNKNKEGAPALNRSNSMPTLKN